MAVPVEHEYPVKLATTNLRERILSPATLVSRRAGCIERCSSSSREAFDSNPDFFGVIVKFYLMK